jgi:hypothetical protein
VARYELSIEIIDAAFSASSWKFAHGDVLSATAVEWGAQEWRWVDRPWGVVFEVAFRRESAAEHWLALPAVRAALDAVPDPIAGLVFHRGWGGTSGSGEPRRGKPLAGAGGAEVPIPDDIALEDAIAGESRDVVERENVRTAACA